MSIHGTRAIQILVEKLSVQINDLSQEVFMLIAQFTPDILELANDVHSNHVIQAFLTSFNSSDQPSDPDKQGSEERAVYTEFIFQACMRFCREIGTHKHGCCVM